MCTAPAMHAFFVEFMNFHWPAPAGRSALRPTTKNSLQPETRRNQKFAGNQKFTGRPEIRRENRPPSKCLAVTVLDCVIVVIAQYLSGPQKLILSPE